MTAAAQLPAVIGDDAQQNASIRGRQVPATVTIEGGASLSNPIDLGRYRLMGIILPSAWVAANLSFQASVDDTTYVELTDDTGTAVSVTGTANVFLAFGSAVAAKFAAVRFLKVRSGTSGSPVNQLPDMLVTLVLEPTP
jgi:hypothetical protein